MPVGRVSYSGSLGGVGKTNPTALGTAAVRLADKAGLGGGTAAPPKPPTNDPVLGKAMADAFGIPAVKKPSKGRQNVAVVKAGAKPSVTGRKPTGAKPIVTASRIKLPKSKPKA